MQSSIAILLRAGILLGCLAALPLMAAGGVGGVDKFLSEASSWLQRHQAGGPITVPRTIQVELPVEALQYRDFAPLTDTDLPEPMHLSRSPDRARQYSKEAIQGESPQHQASSGSFGNFPSSEIHLVSNSTSPSDSANFNQNTADNIDQSQEDRYSGLAAGPQYNANQIGQILRDSGAVEVKLQPWGSSGNLYRYQAIMSIGGSGDVQRHFQAVHADPDLAAQEVLQQVKFWLQQ